MPGAGGVSRSGGAGPLARAAPGRSGGVGDRSCRGGSTRGPAYKAGPARIALRAALMLVLLAGCTPTAPSANTSPSTPIQTTATSAPSASPIDTTNWTVYESKQYGFSIKHPPGWEVWPAERDWTLKADAGQEGRGGQETFVTPAGDLYVAVWSAPAKDTPQTPEGVAAWVEQYCKLAGRSSCSGLDRSVPLCNGTNCDPGLLVTVDGDSVEASSPAASTKAG
jgi:hypothetical protein